MAVKQITTAVLSALASWDGLCHSSNPAGDYPFGDAPIVLYTDVPTISNQGGENDKGGYLSIFGLNFGSAAGMGTTTKIYIGGVEVDNYRVLGDAAGGAMGPTGKFGIQRITVQVGALAGLLIGQQNYPVVVSVLGNNSNDDVVVRPRAGRVIFAALDGNDSTGAVNDIAHPYRHLQVGDTSAGVYGVLQAGDQIVIRGGNWTDVDGKDGTWMRFSYNAGVVMNGTATAYIHVTGYPGPIGGNAPEDVHYTTPGTYKGGFHGIWSARAGQSGAYCAFSNLRMEMSATTASDGAPFNTQTSNGPWWVTNNEIGPWPVAGVLDAKAGAFSGHGKGNRIRGNYVHDIAGTAALENHGFYADTYAFQWEVAYNAIINMTGGSGYQCNDNEGGVGNTIPVLNEVWLGFTDFKIHHNWIENTAKYGINFNDQGGVGGTYTAHVYNNVVLRTAGPPLRYTIGPGVAHAELVFAHNTIYDCATNASSFADAYFANEWAAPDTGNVQLINNIFAFGPNTVSGCQWLYNNPGGTYLTAAKNIWFGGTQSPSAATIDASRITTDPQFTDAANDDFSLGASSPALNVGTETLPYSLTVTNDLLMLARPQGTYRDLGALERAA